MRDLSSAEEAESLVRSIEFELVVSAKPELKTEMHADQSAIEHIKDRDGESGTNAYRSKRMMRRGRP